MLLLLIQLLARNTENVWLLKCYPILYMNSHMNLSLHKYSEISDREPREKQSFDTLMT